MTNMKIIIEHDKKKKEVFDKITDAYICIRQLKPMTDKKKIAMLPETKSYSWGVNVRELLKELRQSEVEIQNMLNKLIDKQNDSNK